ncbi:MAG: diguanylate cyclase [Anaerolineaceae bacterium]|nr:diguanylate cyclase [Anaerolineaceae bacterium]
MTDNNREQINDPLTGALSRVSIQEKFEEEIKRAKRYEHPFSLILIDLDHFKSINDGFGHSRGDEVLIEFTRRLQDLVRETDVIFRYGGDEFIILLPNTDNLQGTLLAKRVLENIRSSPFPGNPQLSISMSMGVATFPDDGENYEEIFNSADKRHYLAKRAGRSCVVGKARPIPGRLAIESPSRMLERDSALEILRSFIDSLHKNKSGVLSITGPKGVGKTRLLQETAKTANLRNLAVLNLTGEDFHQNRVYGALYDALKEWGILTDSKEEYSLPHPADGIKVFSNSIHKLLSDKGFSGLIITLDGIHNIDETTIDFMQDWLLEELGSEIPIGLAYTTEKLNINWKLYRTATYREKIELLPLSPTSVKIWIRHSLYWEFPHNFIDWFYQETQGLPKNIQYGLSYLVTENHITRNENRWLWGSELFNFNLAEKLRIIDNPPTCVLPVNLSTFLGREKELNELKPLILDHRTVTIVGASGQGKTRLAIQTAREIKNTFPDGVFFVPLNTITSSDYLIVSIAEALGFSFSENGNQEQQLIDFLRQKNLLLILDGFEQLLSGVDWMVRLVMQTSNVKVLITSRVRLKQPHEINFELHGLTFPDLNSTELIQRFDAVDFFLKSASRVCPGFKITPENEVHIIRICQLMEGIPLGLELAAAWVQSFTCKQIVQRIENSLILPNGEVTIPDYVAVSLNAIVQSFWSLLFENEQQVMRKLSVFRGGMSATAAGKIAGASPFFLDALGARYFMRRVADERYQTHELLRQFAAIKLERHPNEKLTTRNAHSHYFLSLLNKHETHLNSSMQLNSLDAISSDIENIREAWKWSVSEGLIEDILSASICLFNFYYMRSWFEEGYEAFSYAVETWQKPEHIQNSRALGVSRIAQGWFAFLLGKQEIAQDALTQGVSLLKGSGNKKERAFGYSFMGAIHYHLNDFEKARTVLQKALKLSREMKNSYFISLNLNILGQTASLQEDFDLAQIHFHESLKINRESGDRWGMAFTLEYFGQISQLQGNHIEARQLFMESLQIRQEMGDQRGMGMAMISLGSITQSLGEFSIANKLFQEALSIYKSIGNQTGIMETYHHLGLLAVERGNQVNARNFLEISLKMAIEANSKAHILDCLLSSIQLLANHQSPEKTISQINVILHQTDLPSRIKLRARDIEALHKQEKPEIRETDINNEGKTIKALIIDILNSF